MDFEKTMSRQDDLQHLILDQYSIINETEQEMQFSSSPIERRRHKQFIDSSWLTIEGHLQEIARLFESGIGFEVPDEILEISAHFPYLIEKFRKKKESNKNSSGTSDNSKKQNSQNLPFIINYQFVKPFLPNDSDTLAQFIVEITSRKDSDFSRIDIQTHICLVLDISGSMDDPIKYPYLLEAIPFVINNLSENDWITIILFSSQSELILSKSVAECHDQTEEIKRQIDQAGMKFGMTNLAPALDLAVKEIEHYSKSHPQSITRMYVLTDGQLQDPQECYPFSQKLVRLEVEINSYGFGADFAEETMRKVMEGCQGGRVKWVRDTDTLWQSFCHIGETASNLVATDTELRVLFEPTVTPGDGFCFQPGKKWFGPIEPGIGFNVKIGGLEKERQYIYAFEARTFPTALEREKIATIEVSFNLSGKQRLLTREIFINRSAETWRQEQENEHIHLIFTTLEKLRTNDPEVQEAGLRAEYQILQSEGGDPNRALLIAGALEVLQNTGSLAAIPEQEMRRLRADAHSTMEGSKSP